MRQLDYNKLKRMVADGATVEDLLAAFRERYPLTEITKFLPEEKPKPVRKKRVVKKAAEESPNDVGSDDM